MSETQKLQIEKAVKSFADLSNINDESLIVDLVRRLTNMHINDAIDNILVSLNDLLRDGKLKQEDIFGNVNLLLSLNPEKYKTTEDLISRLNWIKGMNMEHPSMPLTENHRIVLDSFDKFNSLLQDKFDCYYTGGLMGYIQTGHELERYHGDLDLFINEEQLVALKELVDSSDEFQFVSNMRHKEEHGHEYKIVYKGTPMSIGLFLFERHPDQSITTKEYYYENQDINGQLLVDEHHFTKTYTDLSFSNQLREHNGIPFRMMSLESIYNSKKNSRPKDRYDAGIIKDNIDLLVDYQIDVEKRNNHDVFHKKADNSIIQNMEHIINEHQTNPQLEQHNVSFEKDGLKIEGTTYIIPPSVENDYQCGFSLFVPSECENETTLLVHSCNTGGNVPIHLNEANKIAKESTYSKPNPGMWFGNDLHMPVMIPLIPRVEGYYTQALGSKVLHNDVSGLIEDQARRNANDRLSNEEIMQIREQCMNIPEQLVNMIKASKPFLEQLGIEIDDKVIMEGYSAGSKFANCFTALHPEIVKACICGGNSGLGILPINEMQGEQLCYPLGVADIPSFDYDAFIQIPQLFYIGDQDYNDPAMVKCNFQKDENGKEIEDARFGGKKPEIDLNGNIIPKLDENGKIVPRYKENYTQQEFEQIHALFGTNPQDRFENNQKFYESLGVNATFQKFSGNHNSVTQNHNENYYYTNEYVKDFIKKTLQQEKQNNIESGIHK